MVLLELYWSFLLIGFSSFLGGLSMIPQIFSQVISHGWMTASQVTDIVAIAEMTPGPLGLNCATFAGMQAAGIPGAIVANLGALTPALTLCAVAAAFFRRFRDSRIMQRILLGGASRLSGYGLRRSDFPLSGQLRPARLHKSALHRHRAGGSGTAAQVQGQHSGDHLLHRWPGADSVRCSGHSHGIKNLPFRSGFSGTEGQFF